MPNPERLFRDAEGAALERVARLEDENRRLRAEVERLSAEADPPRTPHASPPASHPLPGRFFVLAMALPLAMISLLLAVGPRHHGRPHPPPRYGETTSPRSFQMAPCAPPYTVDELGDRHYNRECFR